MTGERTMEPLSVALRRLLEERYMTETELMARADVSRRLLLAALILCVLLALFLAGIGLATGLHDEEWTQAFGAIGVAVVLAVVAVVLAYARGHAR